MVSQMQHPQSLNFTNQKKAYILRKEEKLPFRKIAKEVRNLQKRRSTEDCVRRTVARFSVKRGMSKYRYENSGRSAWKFTPEIKKWLIKRLLALRHKIICTSAVLQREVARTHKLEVSDSAIRKVLAEFGYHWLRRSGKRQYSKKDREKRMKFAKVLIRWGKKLWERLSMAIDGVVLATAPQDLDERYNHCHDGDGYVYRKKNEKFKKGLEGGDDMFAGQVPIDRAVPMWGGLSASGVCEIVMHATKKCQVNEWVKALRSAKLAAGV